MTDMIASALPDGAAPTGGLPSELEAGIRADLAAVPAPPWRWIGTRNAGGPQLVTDHSGRQYLLRAAKPTDVHGDELLDPELECPVYGDLKFRDQRDGERYSSMRTGSVLGVGRTEYDPDALVDVANPVARWLKNSPAHAATLLAELDRVRAELKQRESDLAPYEVMNPQQCQKGIHADWLADSEYTLTCPWCRVAELETARTTTEHGAVRAAAAWQKAEAPTADGIASALAVIVKHGDMSDAVRQELRDLIGDAAQGGQS